MAPTAHGSTPGSVVAWVPKAGLQEVDPMSYIGQGGISREGSVYQTRLHWVVFSAPLVYMLFGFITLANHVSHIGWVFVTLGLLGVLLACINYALSEFSVTPKRVLIKTGFMRRRSIDLARANGIAVNQGVWARILGYGTLVVGGTGGAHEKFHNIKAAPEFHKRVQEQIAAAQAARKF
jgi:uncharacterized membrane protein YdbT with pleckstrin-like domain